MSDEFGDAYARSLAEQHVLSVFGGRTVAEAIDQGEHPRVVWLALCDDMEVPPQRRRGRDARPAREVS